MDKETAFIIKFTVCFVVAAIILIGAGYVVITAISSIDFSGKTNPPTATPFVPTIDPQTTPDPTRPIFVTIEATPSPTPVLPRYAVSIKYEGDASSRTYKIIYTLGDTTPDKQSDPIDMGLMRYSLSNGGSIREEKTYSALKNGGASWSNSNGDDMLEAGETFSFTVSYYALDISPDTQSDVIFYIGDEAIKTTTLPVIINPVFTEPPKDPEATVNP